MARTTHVKAAQQRYRMVPVIDPETGQQKVTPVLRKDGTPKTNKHGRPTVRRATREDRTQPLAPYTCDSCHKAIEVGTPYKWIKPKSGPYGGRLLTRHGSCPGWQVWDYSSSLSARLAQVSHDFRKDLGYDFSSPEEVTDALSNAASAIREIADEKRESASNIEEGFGHPTSMSEELEGVADDLESWADEVEQADVPDLPEPEEGDCEECGATGKADQAEAEDAAGNQPDAEDCETCNGTGQVTPDEPTEEQMDEWRSEVEDVVSIVDESPV